jgi:hypothetical protein
MIWPMRFPSTLAASLLAVIGLCSTGLAAQNPAPAPAPQQKPAQPIPRAPAAPAAPAPAGMADQAPFYEGEYIPGLKSLPLEELDYPHLEASGSPGGGEPSTGEVSRGGEGDGTASNRPGFLSAPRIASARIVRCSTSSH